MPKTTPQIIKASFNIERNIIYLDCANYCNLKLSYRFEETCDLEGGGTQKIIHLIANSFKTREPIIVPF